VFDKLVDLLVSSLRLFQFFEVVDAWERGIVLRFGKFHREVGPGLRWFWPLSIEQLYTLSVVPDPEKLDAQTLTTEDNKIVTLRAVVTYQIVDVKLALLAVSTVRQSLEDACSGEIGRLVSETKADDLVAKRFWTRLTRACAVRAQEWGIEVIRVQLSDCAVSRNVRLWTTEVRAP
jgi:membrane protease subunit HflK